jgi:8-oxo-dGTP diphosphatase
MSRAHADRARNSSSVTAGLPELSLRADIVHVVAGVIRDAAGRILLTQRPPGKHLEGLWEFPGGKCEPNETPQDALRRELHEEIGIEAGAVRRLISFPWHYAEKSIFLDVYDVLDFRGGPVGREGQAMRWESAEQMRDIAMPAADVAIVTALRLPDRYAITPEPDDDIASFLAQLNSALNTGVKLVQLRCKHLENERLIELVQRVHQLTRQAGARLLLNSHVQIARELALDGVHLPAAASLAMSERPLGKDFLVGVSAHTADDLRHAVSFGADFAVLGPVLETKSHPDASLLGWESFANIVNDVALPVYALGGLSISDIPVAREAGAQGVAGISALWK